MPLSIFVPPAYGFKEGRQSEQNKKRNTLKYLGSEPNNRSLEDLWCENCERGG